MKCLLILALCLVLVSGGRGRDWSKLKESTGCSGNPNYQAVWQDQPVSVANVTNGQRYVAGFANDTQPLSVVHVWGTPYEMGFAVGTLMAAEIQTLIPDMYVYVGQMIGKYIGFLPPSWQKAIETQGVNFLLDLTLNLTAPYTASYFYEELQGLAAGSGVAYEQLARLAMFPEATSMACTIVGANGPAGVHPDLLQLRALDWGADAPTANFPLLLVYHPNSGNGHSFAQLGWPGLVGAVTGLSPYLFQSEKVWDRSNSIDPRTGIPATFLIRDILQFDRSIEDSLTRLQNANRTCSFFLGLGERSTNAFTLVENSFQHEFNFTWSDFPAYPGHPIAKGLVYVDKHEQPSNWKCMQNLMNQTYGALTSEVFYQQVTALAQTGDQHIAVFDQGYDYVYVAVAAAATSNGTNVPAYNRPFLRFDMSELLNHPAPSKESSDSPRLDVY